MMELWQPETSLQPMQGPVPETTITDEHVPVRMTQVQHAATKEQGQVSVIQECQPPQEDHRQLQVIPGHRSPVIELPLLQIPVADIPQDPDQILQTGFIAHPLEPDRIQVYVPDHHLDHPPEVAILAQPEVYPQVRGQVAQEAPDHQVEVVVEVQVVKEAAINIPVRK